MEYPIWGIPWIGGGVVIAVIAILHVYVAHFAVGGGLYLVLTEIKARRENSEAMMAYLKKHTLFFLLLTMVFGGLSGVGIWFSIHLNSPAATSELIHIFVFGWATEYVFFVIEIVSLLIMYYKFDTMRPRDHLFVAWVYCISAWMSLFIITGIINFMLTPGEWLETRDFWDGFWNPSFLPGVAFRTFMAFSIAGIFAFVTASHLKDKGLRARVTRYSAIWTVAPFALMIPSAWWYFASLPEGPQMMIMGHNREIAGLIHGFMTVVPLIMIGGAVMALRMPGGVKKGLAYALLILGLVHIGVFEYVREHARRPYLIHDYLYSSSVYKDQVPKLNEEGFLKNAKWSAVREVTDENMIQAGQELFNLQCLICHSIGGRNDIRDLTRDYPVFGLEAQLTGQGRVNEYMPPFIGTDKERRALAEYIVNEVNGGYPYPRYGEFKIEKKSPEIPPFDREESEYVLLAWNNLGMHCISDASPWWVLLPPANDIYAHLIKRGMSPQIVTEGVKLTYEPESGFENPDRHDDFWKVMDKYFGKAQEPGVGVSGKGMSGEMDLHEKDSAFVADLIPVVPYPDDGVYNPYPMFTIKAHDEKTGELLAETKVTAPTTTEMGCKNCHGGPWKIKGVAGFSEETSKNVLKAHDKLSGTNLLEMAEQGEPRLCQSCHPDPVLGTEGQEGLLNFPAALHGFHANYLTDRGADACWSCHPSHPDGPTKCFRGFHVNMGHDCTTCHGYMEDHALSLLKPEAEKGKEKAVKLMANLKPRMVESVEQIKPRTPWLNEPDCTSCHDFQEKPWPDTKAFNKWVGDDTPLYRMRHDELGALMCSSCHHSTHAVYPPQDNPYGDYRDSIQPKQYQNNERPIGAGEGNCDVCHKDAGYTPDMSMHHPIITY